jgi:hypothetical protein
MRELKLTVIQEVPYLYPIPVMKEKKYLVRCESITRAHELMRKISALEVAHPDLDSADFQFVALHSDQRTKVIECCLNF